MITEFSKYRQEPKVEYYDNGQKYTEKYYLNGNLHREDGPAYQEWYEDGQKKSDIYYLNGDRHREDGPACQYWGPAYQRWYSNGQKEYEIYYLNGKSYSKSEWIEKLKEIKSPHYKEQKILYDSEKYNL